MFAATNHHRPLFCIRDVTFFFLPDPPTIKAATTSMKKSWIGQTVRLTCESDGVPTPTLNWSKPDGSQIKSITATQNTADVKMSVDQDFGDYKCEADNGLTPDFKTVKIEQIGTSSCLNSCFKIVF